MVTVTSTLNGPSLTDDWSIASSARHRWHTMGEDHVPGGRDAVAFMAECGVCQYRDVVLDCRLVTVVAPFIDPDTGRVV